MRAIRYILEDHREPVNQILTYIVVKKNYTILFFFNNFVKTLYSEIIIDTTSSLLFKLLKGPHVVLAIAATLSSGLTANYNAGAIDEVQTCLRAAGEAVL